MQAGFYGPPGLFILGLGSPAAISTPSDLSPLNGTFNDVVEKTAATVEDFTLNWATRGLGTDTISTSTWSVSPTGLTLEEPSNTTTTSTIWLADGVSVTAYKVTNTITTSGGRTFQDSFVCIVEG